MEAGNYWPERSVLSLSIECSGVPRERPEQQHHWREAVIQPNWRPSAVQQAIMFGISNHGWQRCPTYQIGIILRDYGKTIYKASSRSALLTAWKAAFKDTIPCTWQASSTETSQSTSHDQ
jgi:hypothetical protein